MTLRPYFHDNTYLLLLAIMIEQVRIEKLLKWQGKVVVDPVISVSVKRLGKRYFVPNCLLLHTTLTWLWKSVSWKCPKLAYHIWAVFKKQSSLAWLAVRFYLISDSNIRNCQVSALELKNVMINSMFPTCKNANPRRFTVQSQYPMYNQKVT